MTKFSQCAAAWAAQTGKHRKASSMSYDMDGAGYSWRTRIVQLHATTKGQVAFITSDRWSDSTSRATGEFKGAATNAGIRLFVVPQLGVGTPHHLENIAYLSGQITAKQHGAARARTPESEASWHRQIEVAKVVFKSYVEFFDLAEIVLA